MNSRLWLINVILFFVVGCGHKKNQDESIPFESTQAQFFKGFGEKYRHRLSYSDGDAVAPQDWFWLCEILTRDQRLHQLQVPLRKKKTLFPKQSKFEVRGNLSLKVFELNDVFPDGSMKSSVVYEGGFLDWKRFVDADIDSENDRLDWNKLCGWFLHTGQLRGFTSE